MTTVFNRLKATAENFGEKIAFEYGEDSITYRELYQQSISVAMYLKSLGIEKSKQIGLVTESNSLEAIVLSFAAQAIGAIEVPLTNIHCKDQDYLESLDLVVSFIPDIAGTEIPKDAFKNFDTEMAIKVDGIQDSIGPDEIAAIIRTSGTTGDPKGCKITQNNFLSNVNALGERISMSPEDRVLCSLPLWHLYARLAVYSTVFNGAHSMISEPTTIRQDLKDYKPTIFPSFPLIWEIVYDQIFEEIEKLPFPQRALSLGLLNVSRTYAHSIEDAKGRRAGVEYSGLSGFVRKAKGKVTSRFLGAVDALADRLVYQKIRDATGGYLRAAIIGDDVPSILMERIMKTMDFPIITGYGLTEALVVATATNDSPIGFVKALDDISILIGDQEGHDIGEERIGEIFVNGPNVSPGYESGEDPFIWIKGERYLRTGDLGRLLDLEGEKYLQVFGRANNRFILSTLEPVYPERMENYLRVKSRWIKRAQIIGKDRPHTLLLIEPDYKRLLYYHAEQFNSEGINDLLKLNDLEFHLHLENDTSLSEKLRTLSEDLLSLEFKVLRKGLKRIGFEPYEIPIDFLLLDPVIYGKETTLTTKLRRHQVLERYEEQIDQAYALIL